MDILKKAFHWLIYSSNDTQALSLTLKAGAALLVLVGFDKLVVEDLSSGLLDVITNAGVIFSYCITLFGAFRKLWNALKTS